MIVRAVLALSLVLFALPVSAQDVGEVAARVHREGGYAGQLPVEQGANRPSPTFGDGDGASAGGPGERRRSTSSFGLPSASPLIGYLLVALAIAAVAALLIAVLARTRVTAPFAPASAPPSPPPDHPFAHLDLDADPDALARDGRYGEAITAALIRGLRAVGWNPEAEQRSRTAREILASVDPSDSRRSTLAELLRIEERVTFAGDEPTRTRWDEARERWMQLDRGEPT